MNYYNVHGIKVKVDSCDHKFLNLVDNYLNYFKISEETQNNEQISIKFDGYLPFYKYKLNGKRINFNKRLSSDLYYDSNTLLYNTNRFTIEIKELQETMNVWGSYKERVDHFFRRFFKKELLQNNYQEIIRLFVYFPIFSKLELSGLFLTHAAAVANNNKSIIFAGFNGAGKSTLANYMVQQLNYQFQTDNFLLFNRDNVKAFPELTRLSEKSIRMLNIDKARIINKTHGKFHIRQEDIRESAVPKAIFFVSLSDVYNLEEISPKYMYLLIKNMHSYIKEFHYYSYFAAMPFIKDEYINLFEKRDKELLALCERVPCFKLKIPKNKNINYVVEELLKLDF
jgi:hypothetical protein